MQAVPWPLRAAFGALNRYPRQGAGIQVTGFCIWCPSRLVITLQLDTLDLTPRTASPLADLSLRRYAPQVRILIKLLFCILRPLEPFPLHLNPSFTISVDAAWLSSNLVLKVVLWLFIYVV